MFRARRFRAGGRPSSTRLRRWAALSGSLILVVSIATASFAAVAHSSGWVLSTETTLASSEGEEDTDAHPERTNLCEGTLGIPFGTDPSWVRVGGSPDPNTPFVEARGQLLPDANGETNPFVTHTDNPFGHYSKDINAFVTLDPAYRGLLGSGNFVEGGENEHGALEIEWERGGIPMFAFPAARDRITVWGIHIFDCGHGGPDNYRTEIHPPVGWVLYRNTANTVDKDGTPRESKRTQQPWVWYEFDDHQGMGAVIPDSGLLDTPAQATVADAFFSTFGGNAPESVNGCDDSTIIADSTIDADCLATFPDSFEWFSPLLNQDYTFFIAAPPKPSSDAVLIWGSENRCSEVPSDPGNPPGNPGPGFPIERLFGDIEDVGVADDTAAYIGAPTCNIPDQIVPGTQNGQDGVTVTVKAATGGATYPSNHYVAFAKRYKVAWDYVKPAADMPKTYQVDVNDLRVYDDNEPCGEDGEWVMSIRVNEVWVHPVRGHGDGDDPFWASGAVDDAKCLDPDDYEQYSIGESFTVRVVPGEPLNLWERSYDIDFFANDVNPVINAFIGPGSNHVGLADDSVSGAHTIGYTATDITDAQPLTGTLSFGTPQYGPNADTTGVLRINGTAAHETPITFQQATASGVEWRFWKVGSPIPSTWNTDLTAADGFMVHLPSDSASSGTYTIEWATIKIYGGTRKIVSQRQRVNVQLDNTPPALTVPADFEVNATETAGAYVTYTVSATDNFPGPVTISCDHASGSLFPNGHNAPQVTTVTCTATDAVANQTVKSFNVTVKSPFGYMKDYVALGHDWVQLHSGDTVQSGNVGAFDASAGVPSSDGFEAVIGATSHLLNGSQIAAQSIEIDAFVQAGDAFYVDKITVASGATATPKIGFVPLFFGMPIVPAFTPGSANVALSNGQTLAAGNYGALTVSPNAVVTLTGGIYTFTSIEVKPGAEVRFAAATTLEVSGRVSLGNFGKLIPAPGSGVLPRQIVLYALGTDGPPNKPAYAISFSNQTVTMLNAYAPNGTLSIGAFSEATGAFLGKQVSVGSNVALTLDSSFLSP